jgi:very-short-patch-repair endonuclease
MVRQRDLIRANLTCAEKPKTLCDDINCVICFDKSFAGNIPKTLKLVEKNPRFIKKSCKDNMLFECSVCNHQFYKKPDSITYGEYCIYCCAKPIKICNDENCNFCFEKSFASVEKSKCWDFEKNETTPRQIYKLSTTKCFLICDCCNHNFETTPKLIVKGHFCPYCANLKLCNEINCKICYEKTFATHPVSKYWSSKNELLPHQIFKSCHTKYYFDCDKCNHELYFVVSSIKKNKLNCKYCKGNDLCEDKNCDFCFNKSFASSSFAKFWSSKNTFTPRDITRYSRKKIIINCVFCNHEFCTTAGHIKEDAKNCGYCASLKMCYGEKCIHCFNKSFASQKKSKYWSKKNKEIPRNVFKSTDRKYIFDCNYCNEDFETSLAGVTRGSWCPKCVNKTEKKLKEWLYENYGIENVKYQHIIMYGNDKYIYDFYIEKFNLIIELDGLQHFEQVGNWKPPEHNLNNDINKIHLAYKNKHSIIHLLQENVYENKNDWMTKLSNYIKKYDKKSCIFIDDNRNLYENHIQNINNKINVIKI